MSPKVFADAVRERDDALMKSADAMHCAFQAIADRNSTMAVFG